MSQWSIGMRQTFGKTKEPLTWEGLDEFVVVDLAIHDQEQQLEARRQHIGTANCGEPPCEPEPHTLRSVSGVQRNPWQLVSERCTTFGRLYILVPSC